MRLTSTIFPLLPIGARAATTDPGSPWVFTSPSVGGATDASAKRRPLANTTRMMSGRPDLRVNARKSGREVSQMSNPSAEGSGRPVRIVPLPAARLPEVGAVFAGSHSEYPPFRHLFPDPTRRAQVLAQLFTATVRDALPFGTADAAIADDGRLLGGRVAPTWGVPLEHLAQAAVDADVAWSGLGGARRLPGLRAHGGPTPSGCIPTSGTGTWRPWASCPPPRATASAAG